MKRLLNSKLPQIHQSVQLDSAEAHHALQVLRLKKGDSVEIMDGQGQAVVAEIDLREGKQVWLKWKSASSQGADDGSVVPVDLELAVLKGDAMEWAIEKAVELGVRSLTPVITDHIVVRLEKKGTEAFQNRWQKIADQALKQCGRRIRMEIREPLELLPLLNQRASNPLEVRIWANEFNRLNAPFLPTFLHPSKRLQAVKILIGPEGGWSADEKLLLNEKAQAVSLGPSVLRAETAALFSASLAMAYFRSADLDIQHEKTES